MRGEREEGRVPRGLLGDSRIHAHNPTLPKQIQKLKIPLA
jgi:hypothetical protein